MESDFSTHPTTNQESARNFLTKEEKENRDLSNSLPVACLDSDFPTVFVRALGFPGVRGGGGGVHRFGGEQMGHRSFVFENYGLIRVY